MKNKKQQNKNSYFKRLCAIVLFVSLIVQANIVISDAIKKEIKKQKIKREAIYCPPDICTYAAELDGYTLPELPDIEVLDVKVKPIK